MLLRRLSVTKWEIIEICEAWLPTLTKNRPLRSITQKELRGPVAVGVRKSGSPSLVTWRHGLEKSLRKTGLSYWLSVWRRTTSECGRVWSFRWRHVQVFRGSLEVLGGAHWTTDHRNILEAQWMRSSLKASWYRKFNPRVKGSLEMSQLVTLVFSIKRDASN